MRLPVEPEQEAARPRSLAVTYCPLDALRRDPRNERTHAKQQVDQIVASMFRMFPGESVGGKKYR